MAQGQHLILGEGPVAVLGDARRRADGSIADGVMAAARQSIDGADQRLLCSDHVRAGEALTAALILAQTHQGAG
jgi:hypothetical protein